MNWELYFAFVLATAILIIIPGPTVSLIVANSVAYGARRALVSVCGSSTAILLQLIVVGLGMSSVMAFLANWFEWLRWAGVAYLLYLGIQAWRAPPHTLTELGGKGVSRRWLYFQGFVVSATNPKTLFFYAAFIPQFLDPALPVAPQITWLCVSFLIIATTLDSGYALLAGRLRLWLKDRRGARIRNRVTGTLLIGAGLGLALARRG